MNCRVLSEVHLTLSPGNILTSSITHFVPLQRLQPLVYAINIQLEISDLGLVKINLTQIAAMLL